MADIYCDNTNGNDSTGDGSSGTPYKTIQKSVDVATAGDVIWIGDTSAQVLTTAISWASGWGGGTSDTSMLTIRGWDYSGGAGVDGIGEIDANSAAATIFSTTSTPTDVIIYHLNCHDTTGNVIDPNTNWYVVECEIHGGTNGVDEASDGIVMGCNVHDCSASGIRVASSEIVCFNTLANNTNAGIRIAGSDTAVFGNMISTGAYRGIDVNQDGAVIVNNTIVGDGTSNNTGIWIASSSYDRHVIINNLIVDCAGGTGIGINHNSGTVVISGGNQFYNCDTDEASSLTKLSVQANSTADPALVGSGDFTPTAFVDGWPVTLGSTTTENKIGAVQEAGGAAGGGLLEPGSMNGGMV